MTMLRARIASWRWMGGRRVTSLGEYQSRRSEGKLVSDYPLGMSTIVARLTALSSA